jgi:hypothetical protein
MVNDPAAPPPCFILSTPRSGSTLMRYIIDTHPEVCCPSELNLGVLCDNLYLVVSLTLGQTLPDPPGSAANERAVLAEVRRIVDGLMVSYASARGKRVWCEKSPRNLDYLEALNDVFPDGRFICLYRHCMDVAHSYMERVQEGWMVDLKYYARNHGFRNHYGVYLDSWHEKTTAMMAFQRANPDRCFPIRYEDLVRNPAEVLRPLFAFLDLEWDERMLDAVFTTRHDLGPGDPNVAYSKKIHADSLGLGSSTPRRYLPDKMVERLNPVLEELGYETIGPDWGSGPSRHVARHAPQRDAAGSDITSLEEVFANYIPRRLEEQRHAFEGVGALYKFILPAGGGGSVYWMVDTRSLACRPGSEGEEAQSTIVVTPDDLLEMVNGRLNAAKALRQGHLQISGDIKLAGLLGRILFAG